jgi:hypothetical protein
MPHVLGRYSFAAGHFNRDRTTMKWFKMTKGYGSISPYGGGKLCLAFPGRASREKIQVK